jgi:hypothetical protein
MLSGHEPSVPPTDSAQEELFKEEIAKAEPVKEDAAGGCETPILDLTEMVEWFRQHPEDLCLVTKLIQGKKLMQEAIKELEK